MVFFQGSRQLFYYIINSYNPRRIDHTCAFSDCVSQTIAADAVHCNCPHEGKFLLVYHATDKTQYMFEYNVQKGASKATDAMLKGYISKDSTSDEILPLATPIAELQDLVSMSIIDDKLIEDHVSAVDTRDFDIIMKSLDALKLNQRKLTQEVELNHQIVAKIQLQFPDIQVVTQRKNFEGFTQSYDRWGTSQVDLGIFKLKKTVNEITVGHLSQDQDEDEEFTVSQDHIYCATAELKMKQEKMPQLVAGMIHVGSQAVVLHIALGNVIDYVTIYGIMYIAKTEEATLLKLHMDLKRGTATLYKAEDAIKFEDALCRIFGAILK